MAYEVGMAIFFDLMARSVTVVFRDKIVTLPGPFINRQDGVMAGEAYCKTFGWNG